MKLKKMDILSNVIGFNYSVKAILLKNIPNKKGNIKTTIWAI